MDFSLGKCVVNSFLVGFRGEADDDGYIFLDCTFPSPPLPPPSPPPSPPGVSTHAWNGAFEISS